MPTYFSDKAGQALPGNYRQRCIWSMAHQHHHCLVLIIKTIVQAIDIDDRPKVIHSHSFQMGEPGLHQFLHGLTPTDR